MARFKRILLKLSGESLMGKQGYGIDPERLGDYARQIKEIHAMGVEIGRWQYFDNSQGFSFFCYF